MNHLVLGGTIEERCWGRGAFVDVLMEVDEAALPLHHIVVSLHCILPIIEEEEVSWG